MANLRVSRMRAQFLLGPALRVATAKTMSVSALDHVGMSHSISVSFYATHLVCEQREGVGTWADLVDFAGIFL